MIQVFQHLNHLFAIVNQETRHVFCVDCLEHSLDAFLKENIGGVIQVAFESFHVLVETVGLNAAARKNVDEFWAEDICIFDRFVNGINEIVRFDETAASPSPPFIRSPAGTLNSTSSSPVRSI